MYCNACGIYFKNHGKHRPIELIEGPAQTRLHQPLSGTVLEKVYLVVQHSCLHRELNCNHRQVFE